MACSRRVAIIAYNGVDELDLSGVLAPLVKAGDTVSPGVKLRTEVVGAGPFRGSAGLRMTPDVTFADFHDVHALDALVLPGGRGAITAAQDAGLARFVLRARSARVPFYAVCSGALILRDLQLLRGLRVASHSQKTQLLEASGCTLCSGVVRDQWLVSAGGFGPGDGLKGTEIAFSLLQDIAPELVMEVASRMELWPQARIENERIRDAWGGAE
jgi:AraC family transcriptional regulator, transcriptional activator FtrA